MEVHFLILFGAMLLECLWVEMRGVPHLVCGVGNSISFLEKCFYRKSVSRGFVVMLIMVFGGGGLVLVGEFLLRDFPLVRGVVVTFFCYQLLAGSLLIRTGQQVFDFLKRNDLEGARERLTWLVGRDTAELNEQGVRKAALESMAENLSDGMIAPMFYYAIGGLPGMFMYKVINTLDSRFGYKNEKYGKFGYAAAKLDDVVNYIPARLTAVLMIACSPSKRGQVWRCVRKYGRCHLSPNAGYPEAALAGVLGCRFGGAHEYDGVLIEKDWIGDGENVREFVDQDVEVTAMLSQRASWLFLGLIVLCGWGLDRVLN